jgi:hypothetical protein
MILPLGLEPQHRRGGRPARTARWRNSRPADSPFPEADEHLLNQPHMLARGAKGDMRRVVEQRRIEALRCFLNCAEIKAIATPNLF